VERISGRGPKPDIIQRPSGVAEASIAPDRPVQEKPSDPEIDGDALGGPFEHGWWSPDYQNVLRTREAIFDLFVENQSAANPLLVGPPKPSVPAIDLPESQSRRKCQKKSKARMVKHQIFRILRKFEHDLVLHFDPRGERASEPSTVADKPEEGCKTTLREVEDLKLELERERSRRMELEEKLFSMTAAVPAGEDVRWQ